MIWPFNKKFKDSGVVESALERTPIAEEPQGDGPLFGLHPPEGCVFEVCRTGEDWCVIIHRLGDQPAKVYGFCLGTSHRNDREAIQSCARDAIKKYAQLRAEELRVRTYCGTFPPKDTRTAEVEK